MSRTPRRAFDYFSVILLFHGGVGSKSLEATDVQNGEEYLLCKMPGGGQERIVLEKDVFPLVNNKNCPGLEGKPKVFIIKACRGKGVNSFSPDDASSHRVLSENISLDDNVALASPANHRPKVSELLVIHTSPVGTVRP